MNYLAIVSALLTEARLIVNNRFPGRSEEVWNLLAPGLREVAMDLAQEVATPPPRFRPGQAPGEASLPPADSTMPEGARLAGLVPVKRLDKAGTLTTRYVKPSTLQALKSSRSFEPSEPAPAKPARGKLEPVRVETQAPEVFVEPEPVPEPGPDWAPTYRTSEDRPPDFLTVRLERLPFRRVPGVRYDEFRVDVNADPFLRDTGFWEGLSDWQRGFYVNVVADRKSYEQLSKKQQGFYGRIYGVLASWWADLNDDEREAFAAKYLDGDRQEAPLTEPDPRHENSAFPLPKGLEPLAARGYALHEYQKKAANFAADHAPRALWAMEMGLGKTLTALATFLKLRERGEVDRLLVVSPVSAHGAWQSHLEDFTSGLRATFLTGAIAKKRHKAYEDFRRGLIDVLVVSPDAFAEDETKTAKAPAELDKLGEGWTVERLAPGGKARWKREGKVWVAVGMPSNRRSSAEMLEGASVTYNPSDSSRMREILLEIGPKVLRVADEVQKFKSGDAARTRGFRAAVTDPPGRVIGMTGTPKPNKIVDFYEIVSGIKPGALGASARDFADRYGYVDADNQIVALRPDKLNALHRDHAGVMFARTTADPDSRINLPPRLDLAPAIPMDATQRQIEEQLKRYMALKAQARRELARSEGAYSPTQERINEAAAGAYGPIERLAARAAPASSKGALLRWQQLAIDPSALDPDFAVDFPTYESPKMRAVADAVVKHVRESPEGAAVVFCEYHAGMNAFLRALERRGIAGKDVATYDGSTPPKKRREIEKALNTGGIKVLVGQTAALETGANLQKRANFVAHLNTPWAPDRLTQSTARVYRQGQTRKVTVLRPVGSAIESLIERVVTRKVRESAQAVGKKMVADAEATKIMDKREKAKLDKATIAATLGIDEELLGEQGASEGLDFGERGNE